MSDWKVYQYLAEVLVETDGNLRVTQVDLEYITDAIPGPLFLTQAIIEYVKDIVDRNLFLTQVIIEVAYKPAASVGNTDDYLDEFSENDFAW